MRPWSVRWRATLATCVAALLLPMLAAAAPKTATPAARPAATPDPCAAPGETAAIVGARVETGRGGSWPEATVVLQNGRIIALGPDVTAPEGARIIDGAGKLVTPGFIAVETAVGLLEIPGVEETSDGDHEGDAVHAALRAVDAYNPASTLIPLARDGGVTTVVSAPWGGLVAGQALAADLLDGSDAFGDAVFKPSAATIATLGAAGGGYTGGSRALAVARLRELLDDARLLAERRKDFEARRLRELATSRLDLEAMAGVLDGSQPLVVRVHRAADILAVLRLAEQYALRVIISGGDEAWRVAPQLAAAQTPVIVDPMQNQPLDFDRLGGRADNARLLHQAGVPLILMTPNPHNLRALRISAGNAIRAGLPREAALAALTANPARAFGLDDHAGLAVGHVANLVVWRGTDAFEIGTYPEWVFVRGKNPPPFTRQEALLERYCRGQCARSR